MSWQRLVRPFSSPSPGRFCWSLPESSSIVSSFRVPLWLVKWQRSGTRQPVLSPAHPSLPSLGHTPWQSPSNSLAVDSTMDWIFKMRSGKLLLIAVLALGVSDFYCADAFAGRGGGSRSSSSRSSSSSSGWGSSARRSTPSRTTNWGSSSRSSSSPNTGLSTSGSRTRTQTSPRSAADQKLYDKAKASGTAYSSKSAASKAFKSKYSSQYTARYDSKPATRPDHIPRSTSIGGKTFNVNYDPQHGGYGYVGPRGSWIMYDAMTDAAMLSILMSRNNHYYDRPRVSYRTNNRVGSANPWIGIICVTAILAFGAFLYEKQSGGGG